MKLKDLIYISIMTAVICICSWITIPMTIPFTMQTFAVFATLLILGGRNGTISIIIYILLGLAGLPVFSGFNGGIGVIAGPTGGFIISFVLMGIIYLILDLLMKNIKHNTIKRIMILSAGLILCYTAGTVWFVAFGYGNILTALTVCVLPFVLPDAAKMALAVYIGGKIRYNQQKGEEV